MKEKQTSDNKTFFSVCEAIHIYGYDPRILSTKDSPPLNIPQKDVKKTHVRRTTPGRQCVDILKLRTSHLHRMRVMLLDNHNVQERWANGTRARFVIRLMRVR